MRPVHLQAGLVQEVIREHIDSCGSKIGSVLFIKKDGSIRKARFQQAAIPSRVLGTERGIKASATKARNHPNLKTIYEIGNGFRTANLDTVLTVTAAGKTVRYREIERIAPGIYCLVPLVTVTIGVTEESAS